MKRLVVALLIVAMFVSAFMICMPMGVSAADAEIAAAGATITTTWTGTHKTEAELEAETGKDFTVITSYDEFAAIANGTDADNLAYYCLVLPTGTETLTMSGTTHIRALSYIYFDFNGYTVDVSGDNNGVFGALSGCTVKNLKMTGMLRYVSDRTYYSEKKGALGQSPLTTNGYNALASNGVVYLDNIVSEVNWTIYQQHGSKKYTGGIISAVASGSTISNCVFNGTIVAENDATAMAADSTVLASQPGNVGGIVGYATGCTFSNCVSNGSMTIAEDVRFGGGNNGAYLGGIAGYSSGGSYTNCQNNAAITVNSHAWKSASDSTAAAGYVGGITGYVAGTVTYTNCTNNAIVNAAVGIFHTGGIMGSITSGNLTMSYCENTADGVVTSFVSGGTMRGIAGIVGYANTSAFTVSHCINRGSVTQTTSGTAPANVFIGGIIGRVYASAQSVSVSDCVNEGVITGTENATNANSGAGGIVGTLQSGGSGSALTISGSTNNTVGAINGRNSGGIMGTFYVNDGTCTLTITDCDNYANVDAKYNAGGILGNRSGDGTGTLEIGSCNNEGAVSATNNTGGIVGYIGNNATISTCVNKGSVTTTYSGTFTKDVTEATSNYSASAVVRAGGIVGLASEGLTISISGCDNYGSVSASGTATGTLTTLTADEAAALAEGTTAMTASFTLSVDAGGIIPVADGVLTISNCNTYNSDSTITASLTNSVAKVGAYATVSSTPEAAGGIVGRVVVAPTFTGSMTNGNSVDAYYAGGVIGYTGVDLTVSGFTNLGHITGGITSGGIVGHAAQSLTISGCTNGQLNTEQGTVTQTAGSDAGGLGGIVGRVDVNLVMEGCTNYGHVYTSNTYGKAAKYVGGLVGRAKKVAYIGYTVESATTDARVMGDRCYNYGKVTINNVFNNSNTNYVGGILGEAVTGLYVANCENRGDIEVKASIDNASSRSGVGGIVGVPFASDSITGYIDSCDNYGNIIYNTDTAYTKGYNNTWGAAGIAGRIFNNTGSTLNITNCNNFGSIYSNTSVKMLFAGGMVGYHQGCTLVITDCENSGDIDGDYAGGIDGYSDIAVTISGSKNNGHITSTMYAGGIIGYGADTVALTNCTGSGHITATHYAGGLGGYVAKKATLNSCTITDAVIITVTGDYGSNTGYAGGMLGRGATTPSLTDCSASGKIVVCDWVNTEGDNKDAYVAGLVGHSNGGTYTRCISNMTIEITGSGRLGGVGGIVGRSNATITFTDCENHGDISIDATSKFLLTSSAWAQGVGGLYGNGAASTFTNCINTGDIAVYTETAVGGLAGYPANGLMTATDCTNQGTITVSCHLVASSGVGGIVGYGTQGVDLKRCVNDAPINVNGTYHTGGIAGRVSGAKTLTDCENTANGVITFKDDPQCSAMTGVAGIMGYAEETTAVLTYCVNHGNIVMPEDATGHKAYLGGILGRAANPCEFTITYCTNTGDITAATIDTGNISYAGGILALHQSYNAAAGSEGSYVIDHCVNTGNLSAYRTGGILGYAQVGGNSATDLRYAGITITDSINTGSVTAVSYAGGIAAVSDAKNATGTDGADTSTKMTFVITDCANLGTVSGKYVAGILVWARNSAMTITDCISAGALVTTGGTADIIAPVESGDYNKYTDSITGCVYLEGLNVGNGATDAYSATQKTADEITALLRGTDALFIVYDKDNLEILYGIALSREDKTGLEAAMEAVRQIIERGTIEGGERNYFTITQYNADVAYQTLYDLLYPASFESSFTIVLPVSINLSEGMVINVGQLANISPKAKLYIKVAQAGITDGNNFKLYLIGDDSESVEFCFVDANGNEVLSGETLATFDWSSQAGTHNFAAQTKVDSDIPGRYKGTLTFTVDYDAGE